MTKTTVKKESIERALIERRIRELTGQRDQFVSQANQQISALNGAIQALQGLIDEKEPEDEKPDMATESDAVTK